MPSLPRKPQPESGLRQVLAPLPRRKKVVRTPLPNPALLHDEDDLVPADSAKFGARIIFLQPDYLLIRQTRLRPDEHNPLYVLDKKNKQKIERVVRLDDDEGIAEAIRAACQGILGTGE